MKEMEWRIVVLTAILGLTACTEKESDITLENTNEDCLKLHVMPLKQAYEVGEVVQLKMRMKNACTEYIAVMNPESPFGSVSCDAYNLAGVYARNRGAVRTRSFGAKFTPDDIMASQRLIRPGGHYVTQIPLNPTIRSHAWKLRPDDYKVQCRYFFTRGIGTDFGPLRELFWGGDFRSNSASFTVVGKSKANNKLKKKKRIRQDSTSSNIEKVKND